MTIPTAGPIFFLVRVFLHGERKDTPFFFLINMEV